MYYELNPEVDVWVPISNGELRVRFNHLKILDAHELGYDDGETFDEWLARSIRNKTIKQA